MTDAGGIICQPSIQEIPHGQVPSPHDQAIKTG